MQVTGSQEVNYVLIIILIFKLFFFYYSHSLTQVICLTTMALSSIIIRQKYQFWDQPAENEISLFHLVLKFLLIKLR